MEKDIKPSVSVIIPTYNRADYLRLTIKSVLDQTYNNIEVIVIDDGSTDNTEKVVSSFNDKDTKIDLKLYQGSPTAFNGEEL